MPVLESFSWFNCFVSCQSMSIFVSDQYWDLNLKSFTFLCSYSSDIFKLFYPPEIGQYSCYQISMSFSCAINFIIRRTGKNRVFFSVCDSPQGWLAFCWCLLVAFHHLFTVTRKASLVKYWTLILFPSLIFIRRLLWTCWSRCWYKHFL